MSDDEEILMLASSRSSAMHTTTPITSLVPSSPTSVAAASPTAASGDNDPASTSPKQQQPTIMEPLQLAASAVAASSTSSAAAAWSILSCSKKSQRTVNPIRSIVDPIVATIQTEQARIDGKHHISLALGDPSAAGNLPPCPVAIRAVQTSLANPPHAAGYVNACGLPQARQAIAAFHSSHLTSVVHMDQVVIANGCSGALELALTALLESGDNEDDDSSSSSSSILLVPRPGFPLYQVICQSHGARVVHYRLLPEDGWKIDLNHIHELLIQYGSRIRGLLINNPSNPTGAVLDLDHLIQVVDFCNVHKLPIVADEVYGDLVFGDHTFHPLAHVAARRGRHVPVITASGLGKQFLVPGWRVGWLVISDNRHGSLVQVEAGIKRLAQVILGACRLVQTAIPALLLRPAPDNTSDYSEIDEWKRTLQSTLESQANFVCDRLAADSCHGLQVLRPGGAMYSLIGLDFQALSSFTSDIDFCMALLREENIFVLPGSCFGIPNYVRIVFCAPVDVLEIACNRIQQFCQRHYRPANITSSAPDTAATNS